MKQKLKSSLSCCLMGGLKWRRGCIFCVCRMSKEDRDRPLICGLLDVQIVWKMRPLFVFTQLHDTGLEGGRFFECVKSKDNVK